MSRPSAGSPKRKAAGVGTEATLQNQRLDYAPLANLVQANLDGQRLAKSFLTDLENQYIDPDSLYLAIKSIQANGHGSETLATLRGFTRILQKRLGRGAA